MATITSYRNSDEDEDEPPVDVMPLEQIIEEAGRTWVFRVDVRRPRLYRILRKLRLIRPCGRDLLLKRLSAFDQKMLRRDLCLRCPDYPRLSAEAVELVAVVEEAQRRAAAGDPEPGGLTAEQTRRFEELNLLLAPYADEYAALCFVAPKPRNGAEVRMILDSLRPEDREQLEMLLGELTRSYSAAEVDASVLALASRYNMPLGIALRDLPAALESVLIELYNQELEAMRRAQEPGP